MTKLNLYGFFSLGLNVLLDGGIQAQNVPAHRNAEAFKMLVK